MYNTSLWKLNLNLVGFTNMNNIKILPIINNFIFISEHLYLIIKVWTPQGRSSGATEAGTP